ncbi:MAG: hypothetical protein AB7N76_36065 [Planctomycetota bacterium]
MTTPSLRSPLLLLGLLGLLSCAGCAGAPPPAPLAPDPELRVLSGPRGELRTDLGETEAQAFCERLQTLEVMLDAAFGFAASPRPAPVTVVLSDPARFALYARERKVDPGVGAFVTPAGEVVYRFRPEDWADGPPYPTEPRSRPLAGAVLRRRLVLAFGPRLAQTWLEEGMVAVFSELAAHEFGEDQRATVQTRRQLLDAFLPLFLGAPPVLPLLAEARGRRAMDLVKGATPALAWAAVRFLITDPERGRLIRRSLERAAGQEEAEDAWESTRAALDALEPDFERFLLDHCVRELLATVREAPTPVDRWEAAAALRLVANLDLDPDLPDGPRVAQVEASGPLLAEHPPAVRFLDRYAAQLQEVAESRSQLGAMRALRKQVHQEFQRRTQGYGHPAIEAARADLDKALQRAYQRGRS